MTIPEKAVEWAKAIADDDSHGYDQNARWGPDYDCSSLVISAYKAAGVPVTSTYTGNMWRDFLDHGFIVPQGVNLATGAGLRLGDVLLNERNHTALYIGNGKLLHASGNENGGATGGRTGDQTGKEIGICNYFNFPWDVVLRYEQEENPAPTPVPSGQYIVQSGDTLWGIAERMYGDPWRYHDIEAANNLKNAMIYPGQVLIIPGIDTSDPKVTLTITISQETAELLQLMATGAKTTVGEIIEMFVRDAR